MISVSENVQKRREPIIKLYTLMNSDQSFYNLFALFQCRGGRRVEFVFLDSVSLDSFFSTPKESISV